MSKKLAKRTRSDALNAAASDRYRRNDTADPEALDDARNLFGNDRDMMLGDEALEVATPTGLHLRGDLPDTFHTGRYAATAAAAAEGNVSHDAMNEFDEDDIEDGLDDLFGMLEGPSKKGKKKSTQGSKKKTIARMVIDEGDDVGLEDGAMDGIEALGHDEPPAKRVKGKKAAAASNDLAAQVAQLSQLQKQSIVLREEPTVAATTEMEAQWKAVALARVRYQRCLTALARLPLDDTSAEATSAQQQQCDRFGAMLPDVDAFESENNYLTKHLEGLYAAEGITMPLYDPKYWVQRSQKNRSKACRLGTSVLHEYDPAIYNDDDLYTLLVMQLSRGDAAAVAELPSAARRTVADRRRSKGRKLHFEPFPKLVGFKQRPLDPVEPSEGLLMSLFKS